MATFKKLALNALFALQILLLFLLVFEGKMAIPQWLQPVGRMHPLLLHLPIGFLVLVALLPFLRKEIEANAYWKIQQFILMLAALGAVLAAIMGLFLSREDGYASDLLTWHKWLGAGVSFLAYGLLLLVTYRPQQRTLFHALLGVNVILLLWAGHLGAGITHGEDFLWAPLRESEPVVTEETPVFAAAIVPILEKKCFACHNERKAKGELIMTDTVQLLKGGKNGPIWIPGLVDSSHLVQRVRLPLAHEDHMPPEGKAQLTDEEMGLLFAWIKAGADLQKPLKAYPPEDTLHVLARGAYEVQPEEIVEKYDFAPISDEKLAALNTPFRSVTPVALHSPALQAQLFVRQTYEPRMLEELKVIKTQLVYLNLTNLPIGDADLATIAGFSNLEKLILNNTDITGATLDQLKACKNLQSLALAGTKVGEGLAQELGEMPALREVFVWNTSLSDSALAQLERAFPAITFDRGYQPDEKELLQLSPPILANKQTILSAEEPVAFKHNFPGVEIRYTIDGEEPDSLTSPRYSGPIMLPSYGEVKAKAFKAGWLGSKSVQFYLFPEGKKPTQAELINPPHRDYPGKGVSTLLDGEKGNADNFRSPSWLGFYDQPFAAYVHFGEAPPEIGKVVLSYGQNIGSYILPPVKVEVWAGSAKDKLQLLKTVAPEMPEKYLPNQVKGLEIGIPKGAYSCLKIIAHPIPRLPIWHQGKGDKGWVFVDELFFY